MVGGPNRKKLRTTTKPLRKTEEPHIGISSLKSALAGTSSGIQSHEWKLLLSMRIIRAESAERPIDESVRLYEIPPFLSWLTCGEEGEELDPVLLSYAIRIWHESRPDEKEMGVQSHEEGLKFIRIEWLCFKNFLFYGLLQSKEYLFSLIDALDELQRTEFGRSQTNLDKMLNCGKATLEEIYLFDEKIVRGSWMGSVMKGFLHERTGLPIGRPFLSAFWNPSLRRLIADCLEHVFNLNLLRMVQNPPSTESGMGWSSAKIQNMLSDAHSSHFNLNESDVGAYVISTTQSPTFQLGNYPVQLRQTVSCTGGDCEISYLSTLRTVIITPLENIGIGHETVCNIAKDVRKSFGRWGEIEKPKNDRPSLVGGGQESLVRFSLALLPGQKDGRSVSSEKGEGGDLVTIRRIEPYCIEHFQSRQILLLFQLRRAMRDILTAWRLYEISS